MNAAYQASSCVAESERARRFTFGVCSVRHESREMIDTMGRNAARIFALLLVASALAGCDKCADYFIANPFAIKPAGTCQSGAIPPQK